MDVTPEQKEHGVSSLNRMVELLGFTVEINELEDSQGITLSLKTDEPGRLIGRKGHYLQSMELLLNRMMRKKYGKFPWIALDVDGYQRKAPARRRGGAPVDSERLEQMANDAAKEVERWGQEKSTAPLNARDRRVVHVTLRDYDGIVTESGPEEGEGLKRVIVRPADTSADE
ncbi:MAG: KH domain-containing protein [Lentisphaerae bacterium]|jgi:spoIIIJ-associated protein|nr:KH domain-containing protein [Lentisphaerota bacterium]MBT4818390.1 KH domain-containing protein [Lentisphaerota bacterium]MBT5611591.1 KH domain-containing protein [Lentisphaerota bacterium]MBT7061690.1 KH domain-containing protein [Lentisphaerota bacterium]MBT7846536.1 KH domain-containing protein [Lentisphaerota bacterium]